MASIHSEYHRFLAHLAQQEVHDDVRRLAHLVLNNLQPLAEVGATRRARSTRLVPLAVANLAQTPVAYDGEAHGSESGPALGRLRQLEVGPFRGFMRQETFDLSHDITLVYGANGTGKSSFCEALEVAMLGSIGEAQVKRVDQRTYCNNARLRRHVAPVLSSGGADASQAVQPDEAEYPVDDLLACGVLGTQVRKGEDGTQAKAMRVWSPGFRCPRVRDTTAGCAPSRLPTPGNSALWRSVMR
jgi:hypothetical protein